MSFGRWLLVHSFTLFLLALLVLLYLFRSELQLDKAYQQLTSIQPRPEKAESRAIPTREKSPEVTVKTSKSTKMQKAEVAASPKVGKIQKQPDNGSAKPTPDNLVAVPTLHKAQPQSTQLDADLIRARKAYWANDYARAISEYQRLIKRYPQNPDYLGELGNIYYTLNNDRHAAELYFQAAMLFIQQNDLQHARSLLAPVTALDREMGERLQKQLNR